MRKVSFVTLLAVMYPEFVMGYNYTLTDENIRNNSYSVEQITESMYNKAKYQNASAPIFSLQENGETTYYKWIAPDLTQYKTSTNQDVFTSEYQDGTILDFSYYTVNSTGSVINNNIYYIDRPAVNNGTDFINNVFYCIGTSCPSDTSGGVIRNNSNLTNVSGNFIFNKSTNGNGGAIANKTNGIIDTINGYFIDNYIYNADGLAGYGGSGGGAIFNSGTITNMNTNFVGNQVWDGFYGGAIYNIGNIENIHGNFINNTIKGGSSSSRYGGAIYNSETIGGITGDFIRNTTTVNYGVVGVANYGGAINNNYGIIDSINGDFIENSADNGAAIYNGHYIEATHITHSGTTDGVIHTINGNFIGNTSTFDGTIYNGQNGLIETINANFFDNTAGVAGGAIYNYTNAVIGSLSGVFDGNVAQEGGAIRNLGTINMRNTVRFVKESDTIYNTGIITSDGTIDNNANLYLQSIVGNGTLNLNGYTNAYLAEGQTITQNNLNISENSVLYTATDGLNVNHVVNNGLISLTNGTLEQNMSNYAHGGNVEIFGSVSGLADKINIDTTNNGTLTLTDGTLNNSIVGSGNTIIDGYVISNVELKQNTIINDDSYLTISANNVHSNKLTNSGVLKLSGGTLNENISLYHGPHYSTLFTCDDAGCAEYDVEIFGNVFASANLLDVPVYNTGTLTITDGTISEPIIGTGDIVINGDVDSDVLIKQNIAINQGKSFSISANNLQSENVVNNGNLTLNLCEEHKYLSTIISGSGTLVNNSSLEIADINNIDNDIINNKNLYIDGGNLTHKISGTGTTFNTGSLYASANNIQQRVRNYHDVNITEGTLSQIIDGGITNIIGDVINTRYQETEFNIASTGKLTTSADKLSESNYSYNVLFPYINNDGTLVITDGDFNFNVSGNGKTILSDNVTTNSTYFGDLEMNGTWNIGRNRATTDDITINGTVNMEISRLNKNSSYYEGGHISAKNVTFGDNSELRLVVSSTDLLKGESTTIRLIDANKITNNWADKHIELNNRYNFSLNKNQYLTITYLKTGEDIARRQNGSITDIAIAKAWDEENISSNPSTQNIINKIEEFSQYNVPEYINLLHNMAPADTNIITGTSRAINTTINNQISERLTSVGRNGGDNFKGIGLWGQGLYNYSSQSGNTEFTGNTFGLSLGADTKVGKAVVLGLGYTLNNTYATSASRDIDALGHTIFVYGEVRPVRTFVDKNKVKQDLSNSIIRKPWPLYLNMLLSYGTANYKESAGYGISAEYDVLTLGANANIGYDLTDNFGFYLGSRYLKIEQSEYKDSIGQTMSIKDDSILTAIFGAKYTGSNTLFAPMAHLEVLYDVVSNDKTSYVYTPHSGYIITGEAIDPLGVQAGFGFLSNIDRWNLSLNYDMEWHSNFISHTGRFKAKYLF